MATVGHSYFYHTSQDLVKNIERGAAQHFATNIQAIVDYLLSPASPLLRTPWHEPDIVYMSLYDRVFLHWTMQSADQFYVALAAIATALAFINFDRKRWRAFLIALFGTPLGLIVGFVTTNLVAGVMVLLRREMAW
jgi:hypothetical protein